jgi:hypothetical protein
MIHTTDVLRRMRFACWVTKATDTLQGTLHVHCLPFFHCQQCRITRSSSLPRTRVLEMQSVLKTLTGTALVSGSACIAVFSHPLVSTLIDSLQQSGVLSAEWVISGNTTRSSGKHETGVPPWQCRGGRTCG